ncbi:MAG: hypothetical protein P8Y97_11360 [Candidatus Lokiarchaeota archaeon]
MIVKIEEVFTEEIKELRNESWIVVKLENGKKIELYHQGDHDFRKYVGKPLDCLISPWRLNNVNESLDPNKPSLKGIYLGKFIIPPRFKRIDREIWSGKLASIKSNFQFFIIGHKIIENLGLTKGDAIKFNFLRYTLWDWTPIER